MSKLLPQMVLLVVFALLPGCALWPWKSKNKKPESSARMYEGNGPSLRFSDEPETAGGPINPR